jgi:hypothetical protein
VLARPNARRAICRKLVHDRIPETIQSERRRPVTRVLDKVSYREALLAKLVEERLRRQPTPPPTTFPANWPTCWKYSAL